MARSTLERTGERPARVNRGHTTRDLGPGDRSDTGSDVAGGPGLEKDSDALDLQHGTTSDAETGRRPATAGPDIGDENLDSDTDSAGTGERAAAGRDAPPPTDELLSVIDELTGASNLVSSEDFGAELSDAEEESSAETATNKRARARRSAKTTRTRKK